MHQPEETTLSFHCGVCTKQLTDATALFTSCGHFFCASPEATCTRLRPSQGSGRCEQCGKLCDAGNLANKGSRYDNRVVSFVFSDVARDLRTIADIVEFRNNHLQILGENAAAQQKRITTLIEKCNSQIAENDNLQRENKQLRLQLSQQKQMKLSARNVPSPTATRAYERNNSEEVAVIELDPPTRTDIPQRSKRGGTPHEGIRINRATEPNSRTLGFTKQTYDRSLRTRSLNKRRESQPVGSTLRETQGGIRKDHGSTTFKRRWAARTGTEDVYGSSKAGVKSASRFGYPGGESRGTARDTYKTRQRVVGDWQRKVSSVPRPSATPDKLRRRGRRSVLDVNPLGKRY